MTSTRRPGPTPLDDLGAGSRGAPAVLRRIVGALILVAVVLAGPATALAETLDRVAAIVDDEVVTFHDVRIDGKIRLASSGVDIRMLDAAPNRAEQIEQLVERIVQTHLLVLEAERMQAPVGDAEVDARLELIYRRMGQSESEYKTLIEGEGIPWERFRGFLRDELKAQFVIRSELGGQVNIADADIDSCARDKEPGGDRVAEATLRQILVVASPLRPSLGETALGQTLYPAMWNAADAARFSAAAMLYRRAAEDPSIENFEALASEFSSGVSKRRGGAIGTFKPGDMTSEFAPVFDLDAGQISDIIETDIGFHIVLVESRDDVENDAWAKAKRECRAELQNAESEKLIGSWIDTLRDRYFVSVKLFDDLSTVSPAAN